MDGRRDVFHSKPEYTDGDGGAVVFVRVTILSDLLAVLDLPLCNSPSPVLCEALLAGELRKLCGWAGSAPTTCAAELFLLCPLPI